MIKIYYRPDTGHITEMVTGAAFSLSQYPYIIIDQKIKIDQWRVDLQNLKLTALSQ